ncbi:MAG: hypothetical protein LIQ30_07345, partial [Planctomycetes bacterium]|nr:hypothetical protein [Planctomycetota bacterium]
QGHHLGSAFADDDLGDCGVEDGEGVVHVEGFGDQVCHSGSMCVREVVIGRRLFYPADDIWGQKRVIAFSIECEPSFALSGNPALTVKRGKKPIII